MTVSDFMFPGSQVAAAKREFVLVQSYLGSFNVPSGLFDAGTAAPASLVGMILTIMVGTQQQINHFCLPVRGYVVYGVCQLA